MSDPFSSPWLYLLIIILMLTRGLKTSGCTFLSGSTVYLLLKAVKLVFSINPSLSTAMISAMVPWIITGTPLNKVIKSIIILISIVLVSVQRLESGSHTFEEVLLGISIGLVIFLIFRGLIFNRRIIASKTKPSDWPEAQYIPPDILGIWSRAEVAERYPDVASPLFSDLFLTAIGRAVNKMGKILNVKNNKEIIGYKLVNGLIYSNMGPHSLNLFRVLKLFSRIRTKYLEYYFGQYSKCKEIFWKKRCALAERLNGATKLTEIYLILIQSIQLFEEWMVQQSISLFYHTFTFIYLKLWFKIHFLSKSQEILSNLIKGLETPTYLENKLLYELGRELNNLGRSSWKDSKRINELLIQFLDKAGNKFPNYDLVEKTWKEIPEEVLAFSQKYYSKDELSPKEKLNISKTKREEFEKILNNRIKILHPFNYKRVSNDILNITRTINVFKEERQIQMGSAWGLVKQSLARLSDILIKDGYLKTPDDIYYLTGSELAWLVTGNETNIPTKFVRRKSDLKLLSELRKNWFYNLKNEEIETGNSRQSVLEFRNKLKIKTRINSYSKELKGSYGLGNEVEGEVVIIRKQEEFHKMGLGKILVAPATNPHWDILFPIAAGLITETGSPLSHPSIKANEYGLTAVIGVPWACKKLKDGDRVRINGKQKTIHKL